MLNLTKVKLDKKKLAFITFWIINSILLYLAGTSFPQFFTLGNWRFAPVMAAITSGFIWNAIVFFGGPFIVKKLKLKDQLQIAGLYFLVNFAALWLTARIAPYAGFGTVRFVWLLVLAFIANIIQFLAWKFGKLQM